MGISNNAGDEVGAREANKELQGDKRGRRLEQRREVVDKDQPSQHNSRSSRQIVAVKPSKPQLAQDKP